MMYYNNKKLALSIFWVVLGVALFVLALTGVLDSTFSTMGVAFVLVGALQIWRNIKYRRDPEYREKVDIAAGDERIRNIRLQSWAWAGYVVVLLQCAASLVAWLMGQVLVQQTLMFSVCLILVVYLISYAILNKKM